MRVAAVGVERREIEHDRARSRVLRDARHLPHRRFAQGWHLLEHEVRARAAVLAHRAPVERVEAPIQQRAVHVTVLAVRDLGRRAHGIEDAQAVENAVQRVRAVRALNPVADHEVAAREHRRALRESGAARGFAPVDVKPPVARPRVPGHGERMARAVGKRQGAGRHLDRLARDLQAEPLLVVYREQPHAGVADRVALVVGDERVNAVPVERERRFQGERLEPVARGAQVARHEVPAGAAVLVEGQPLREGAAFHALGRLVAVGDVDGERFGVGQSALVGRGDVEPVRRGRFVIERGARAQAQLVADDLE